MKHVTSVSPSDPMTRREFLERGGHAGAGLGLLGLTATGGLAAVLRDLPAGARAMGRAEGDALSLENPFIAAVWTVTGGSLRARSVTDRRNGTRLALPPHAF